MKWQLILAALPLVALMSAACDDNEFCGCEDLFAPGTEKDCERCVCPSGTVLSGLGPTGSENESDCISNENCNAANLEECIDGKCINKNPANPERVRACLGSNGVVDGLYMEWDEEQNKLVECGYDDGTRNGTCCGVAGSRRRPAHTAGPG